MFGSASGMPADLAVADLDGVNGFKISGEHAYDFAGISVSSAGDFNGDGFADMIIGASRAETNGYAAGAAYIVFGKATAFRDELQLSSLNGDNGFQINGVAAGDLLGNSVSGVGDFNGDGFNDVILGAPYGSSTGNESGTAYVLFGAMPAVAVARDGTAIANGIHGGNFNDALSGLGGNDRLFGHDGDDELLGGDDKDVLDSGGGNDTAKGGAGGDLLIGGEGADKLDGGGAGDRLIGGGGADNLNGGKGSDRFVFAAAGESTGPAFDRVIKADFGADVWDMSAAITAVDAEIDTGTLRQATFDADLAAAVNASRLGAQHVVIFEPSAGGFAGKIFLIADLNGVAGYQAGEDLVIQLLKAANLESLGAEDFI